MTLAELQAELLQLHGQASIFETADLASAQGVMFLCPLCYVKNGGEVGTHAVICWFRNRGVPADESPGPGRWDVSGTSIADLTLSPSVHFERPRVRLARLRHRRPGYLTVARP